MFKENSQFTPPDADRQIWRYVDYPSFMWMVQTNQLHFHKSSAFGDPYEGAIPYAIIDHLFDGDTDSDSFQRLKKWSHYIRHITFLNCWHLNSSESAAMWELYGKNDKGIAIKSTIGNLESALQDDNQFPFGIGTVQYADYDSSWESLDKESRESLEQVIVDREGHNAIDLFHLKRDSYSHESEIRVFIQFLDYLTGEPQKMANLLRNYELPFGVSKSSTTDAFHGLVPDEDGFNPSIDVEELIDAVLVSPTADDWVVDSIEATFERTENLGLGADAVSRSEMLEDPWDNDN